jgi:TPR repeat protein
MTPKRRFHFFQRHRDALLRLRGSDESGDARFAICEELLDAERGGPVAAATVGLLDVCAAEPHAGALHRLGVMYDEGFSTDEGRRCEPDHKHALILVSGAAGMGHPDAHMFLACDLLRKRAGDGDREYIARRSKAVAHLREAVALGHPGAGARLAAVLLDGLGSPSEAVGLASAAAASGVCADACLLLAWCHESGAAGLRQDGGEAMRWMQEAERAARKTERRRLAELADTYAGKGKGERGETTDELHNQAVALWLRMAAARQGDMRSLVAVGRHFERGFAGRKPDPLAAEGYYRAAAQMGSRKASLALNRLLAAREVPEGYYGLGIAYARGLGVAKDAQKAREFLREAAGLGHEGAARFLDAHTPFDERMRRWGC